ncbi:MAG TPA: CBS domain-containing protein [Sphingomicrobium sp.]
MRVEAIMTGSVRTVGPSTSIADAAREMSEFDVGALPVVDGGTLVGILTDRDIAVRAVARSMDLNSPVREIMTAQVATCLPQDSVDYALELMADEQVRRIPVCTGEGELVGIFALADAAERDPDKREVGLALEEICEPGGRHRQKPVHA